MTAQDSRPAAAQDSRPAAAQDSRPAAVFGERLAAAVAAHGPLCVGIDPHPGLLAEWGLADDWRGLERFALTCVDALAGHVAVVKPQSAFFERHGSRGIAVLERVLAGLAAQARPGVLATLSLLDVKRGDIGSTMDGYADAYLAVGAPLGADAVTLSPYLGFGALASAIRTADDAGRGVFVLARTSNAEGGDVQLADRAGRSVAQGIVDAAAAANRDALAAAAPASRRRPAPSSWVTGAGSRRWARWASWSARPRSTAWTCRRCPERSWRRDSALRVPLPRTSPPASRACAASCCRRRRDRCSPPARIRPRSVLRPLRCVTRWSRHSDRPGHDASTPHFVRGGRPAPDQDRPLRSAGRHVSVRPRGYYHPGGCAGPCRTLGRVTEEPVDVLIVDDQRPFRSVARTVVNLVGGWRVAAEAETGEDAVAAAERVRPGVVLMDINLPGISGIEATRRIVASHPETTVVLLSTYSAADLPADATTCGATTYLNKEDLSPATLRALR